MKRKKLPKKSPVFQYKLALIYKRPMFDCPVTGLILDCNKSLVIEVMATGLTKPTRTIVEESVTIEQITEKLKAKFPDCQVKFIFDDDIYNELDPGNSLNP